MKNFLCLIISFLFVITVSAQKSEKENMGKAINTPDHIECYPVISPDGKTLYFSRDDGPSGDEDIYYSQLDENGIWNKAVPLTALNDGNINIISYIYPDGNTILLHGSNNHGPTYSKLTSNGWSAPEPVKFESDVNWSKPSATLSPNGKVMFINDHNDLFISFLKENGLWSNPQKIPGLSTAEDDFSPSLAPDGKTLYFSSESFGTFGDNDIFKSVRLDDTWLKWSTPQNLGEGINTIIFDNFFSVSVQGDYAYTYSYSNGDGNIYRVKLNDIGKPASSSVLLKGKVFDAKTKKPINASVHYELLPEGSDAGNTNVNPVTGEYKIILPYGEHYGISVSAEGYLPFSKNLDITEGNSFKEITEDVYLSPVEIGTTLALNNIFFNQGKYDLLPSSYPELDRLVTIMENNPTMEIEIGGHTDNQGNLELNKKLSEDRAKAVMNYLVSKGISEKRITWKGYGGSKPIASNATEASKKLNRRVEFTILKK